MLKGNIKLTVEWMARRGLLHNTHTHTHAGMHACTHAHTHTPAMCECTIEAHRDAKDGYCWKCRQCRRRDGVRSNSVSKSKIALGKLMWLILVGRQKSYAQRGLTPADFSETSVDWAKLHQGCLRPFNSVVFQTKAT